ncbi:MAG: hypothetical protein M3R30_01225, partial [Candidatus Eremiobacteraeota bacterium]|nr:hypothetical protein [Candidatus Eremiobacteraeota bacterium]
MFVATLIAASMTSARAQILPRLDVTSFTFTSDNRSPIQEQLFHLIIDVRIAGRIEYLEGVVLPQLGTLEILDDEKHTTARGSATEYRESIAVVAHRGGTIAIPPAYLDAIDTRDGKPKRFLSDPRAAQVAGPASALVSPGAGSRLLRAVGFVCGALLIVALALAALGLRKQPAPVADPAVPEPVRTPDACANVPPFAAGAQARALLTGDPTRSSALDARSVLWASVGAGEGET